MNVSRITVERLYNLGSYEHQKYSITVDVKEGESAKAALLGLEKILTALAPESKACVHRKFELEHEARRILDMRETLMAKGEEEFRRRQGHFVGTPEEYIERVEKSYAENVAKREAYENRAERARELLDSLGGAADWKDAKLDWENDDDF